MQKRTLFALLAVLAAACSPAAGTARPTPDPASSAGRGAQLFSGTGRCASCHALTAGTIILGPPLAGIASRAGTRVPGMPAEIYLEESILHPNDFLVPGFEMAQMDSTLAKSLTTTDVADLVAFMQTLQ